MKNRPVTVEEVGLATLTIKTNGHYRPLISWYELTDKEQAEYSEVFRDSSFFRYCSWVYTLDDFMRVDGSPFYGWDGYHNQSFFSGLLVKYSSCGDAVKVAVYYS
jgi:hypothetical protein